MAGWSAAPLKREQQVLFQERLDEAIPADHPVRLLDEILGQLSWAKWEARYHGRLGQPAIHPRVLCGVLLYGLLTRIRTSRSLEEALIVRLDFRWLGEGRTIDHTTLSEFRRQHGAELKDLFVQVGMVARNLGLLSLSQLAFDGTRLRSHNRRSGTRTPDELRKLKAELAEKFAALEAQAVAEEAREDETFGNDAAHQLPAELADVKRRQKQVAAALAELERAEEAQETLPKRLPLTDPDSRVTPNKEGGFAPNYTPLATVDVDSGMIVADEVIAHTDEDHYLVAAIEAVQENFGLAAPPAEMLADGLMATGDNLAALAARGVTLYSPVGQNDPANPALRPDPTQPVPEAQWGQLPRKTVSVKDRTQQLDKAAFVYDQTRNCYWCPLGKQLSYANTTHQTDKGRLRIRDRYLSNAAECAACPLLKQCIQAQAAQRQITREQHEELREAHARRMATAEATEKYARRCQVAERPFAVIKQMFGARRFLLRGLPKVRVEWRWLTLAFNLHRLMRLLRSRAGPPTEPITPTLQLA